MRHAEKSSYKWLWFLLPALVIIGYVFLFWNALTFNLVADAQIDDTLSVSPDGAYVAAVRDIDTGAVGNGSCIVLKSAGGQFPKLGFGDGVIADGPYEIFGPAKWLGPRVLQVTVGVSPAPPEWKTQWRDVKIVYKSSL